jgi:hypothetical protein
MNEIFKNSDNIEIDTNNINENLSDIEDNFKNSDNIEIDTNNINDDLTNFIEKISKNEKIENNEKIDKYFNDKNGKLKKKI